MAPHPPRTPLAAEEHVALLRGAGAYVADVAVPGRAWARIVRSSVAHGRIRSVDASALDGVDGVVGVLTADDLDEIPTIPVRIAEHEAMAGRHQPGIARDRVRYVGEPVAIVVAVLVFSAGVGLTMPAVDADIADLVSDRFRAGALSLRNSTTFLGRSVGPILFAGLAIGVGYRPLLLAATVLALLCGLVTMAAANGRFVVSPVEGST